MAKPTTNPTQAAATAAVPGRQKAADARARALSEISKLRNEFVAAVPDLTLRGALNGCLDDLEHAQDIRDWNRALAQMISALLPRAAPTFDEAGKHHVAYLAGSLRFLIGRGFPPPANRPTHRRETQGDILDLQHAGMLTRDEIGDGDLQPSEHFTRQEAMLVLHFADRFGVFPWQSQEPLFIPETERETLANRVKRAVEFGTLRLTPGRRVGQLFPMHPRQYVSTE